jgi:regulator of replication initiation timing
MLEALASAASFIKNALSVIGRCRAWLAALRHARENQTENTTLRLENAELRSRVQELESRVTRAQDLVYSASKNVYWRYENGQRVDGPFCALCVEHDAKAVRLVRGATPGTYHCHIHRESFTTAEYSPRPALRLRRRPREF